ncbi:glutamate transporter polyphemus-like [Glossina fuscipes]|uniref:Glutamate transporter polyphemus-like n=1 Tax=Glossina fuscipes TaxID=7396 RepID=A0A9C5ZF98_9MUSC|nr:glutamate transporter polyphemus-like [Glossina fuscipes]
MDGRNYDAYEHRDNGIDKLSYVTALMHLMKFIWSTGMLIVPYAFQNIGWLMALGILIVIIALTTIGLHVMFLNVEEDMKEPLDFVKTFGVLNAFMLATFLLAAILGLTGYWFYGEETAANFILNIPISQSYGQFAKIICMSAFYFSYPMHCYVLVDIVWNTYCMHKCQSIHRPLFDILARVAVTFLSANVAALLRYLDIIAALTGCLPLNFLVLILPAVMDLCVLYESGYGRYKLSLIRDICLISFGILLSLVGVSTISYEIVKIPHFVT